MKKVLAIIVAAAFASAAFAQKDVTTKGGGATNATTKDVKDKPKHPAPKLPKGKVKAKEPKQPGEVKTKRGEAVTDKKGADVKSGQK